MSEPYPGYDPDAIADEGDEDDSKKFQQWRSMDVFLIDAQPSMHQECGMEADGIEPTDTWFGIALKVVRATLKQKIISSPNDQSAVVFYGTRESKNLSTYEANTFEHVYLFQEMRVPSARRIRECESLLNDGAFAKEIGSRAGRGAEHLKYGLWLAGQQLSGGQKASKAIHVYSNNLDPSAGGKPKDKEQVQTKISELEEQGAEFDLTPMVPADQMAAFQRSGFWRDVLPRYKEGSKSDYTDYSLLPSVMLGLGSAVRYKAYKKRPLRTTRMTFGSEFSIGIQLFATIKAATKSSHTWVSAQRHEPLRSEGAEICEDTGAQLTTAQLHTRVFPKQSDAGKTRHPQVFAKVDELKEMKQFVPEGIHVLGFKPLSSLKDYHQMREPTFIYPEEKRMPGSSSAFIALHGQMLAMKFMAVASFSRGSGSMPKLVALLANQELQDEDGAQIDPPGLYMIQLPFLDDIRNPETDPAWVGEGHPTPDGDAVDAAADMIAALSLPDFFSGMLPNPSLQRHYQVLEALALEEGDTLDTGDEPLFDPTLPDDELFSGAAKAIEAFKDAVYGKGFTGDIDGTSGKKAAPKRKAADMAAEEKDFASETNWAELAKSGQLGTLNMVQLKTYLKQHSLPLSGKKADLISRIEQHITK